MLMDVNKSTIFECLGYDDISELIIGSGYLIEFLIENLFDRETSIKSVENLLETLKVKDVVVDPFQFYNTIYNKLNDDDANKKYFIYIIYSSFISKKPVRFLIMDLIEKIDSSLSFNNDYEFCYSIYQFLFENDYKSFDITLKGTFIIFLINSILENFSVLLNNINKKHG